jgi:hypothetical protein
LSELTFFPSRQTSTNCLSLIVEFTSFLESAIGMRLKQESQKRNHIGLVSILSYVTSHDSNSSIYFLIVIRQADENLVTPNINTVPVILLTVQTCKFIGQADEKTVIPNIKPVPIVQT